MNPKYPYAHSCDLSSTASQRQLEVIKEMMIEGATQLDMSRALNLDKSMISKKIGVWVQTEDFQLWVKQAWVTKYAEMVKENPKLAFNNLTRLFAIMLSKEAPATAEKAAEIVIRAWKPDQDEK